ncbi:dolichyl-phosphate-mannose--protein mannosyltransferase [Actinomadura sp. CNU-125]|uniref:dolichyl-phosphate-mannose--protein mannosyltransferase n=1 Tax=Actinomadura sp. CNU-125 TaxID=1904961 RepID=UPI000A8C908F|nr:phospholipid carrier-dependent glycosyltransferase [Actinomadura sp. CNU-125]
MTASAALEETEPAAGEPPRGRGLPWAWLGPLLVAAAAGALVFHRLGEPHALVWDETYYAKDAWSLLHFGVEHGWNADREGNPANGMFLAGHPESGLSNGPEWAAHPPLGKWLIAAGIALFGPGPFGFRAAAALAGVLTVLVLARTARRMTGSTVLGCAAGLLLALDGSWLVSSRLAMLDVFLLLWLVAGFACLVADRDRTRAALAGGAARFLGRRWRFAAGICFGLACATKWSAVYAVAFLWVLVLLWDRKARADAGADRPWRTTAKLDAPLSFVQFWVVAGAVYLASWWGWFASGTGLQRAVFGRRVAGFQRDWAAHHPSEVWPSFLDPIRSLWHYHAMNLDFHANVTEPNPAQSWPWEWPWLGRPAVMFRSSGGECGAADCAAEIAHVGTPAIWWASLAALVAVAAFVRGRWAAAVVGGYLACWLPWFPAALDDRTMYSTYTLPMLPFAVLALVLLARRVHAALPVTARAVGVVYLLVVAANLYFLHPILTAEPLPEPARQARLWLPGWS